MTIALVAVVAACSHGARGQRGGDDDETAVSVPVDAAVIDAPVDAEVDALGPDAAVVRAGPPEWDWWDVRRHSPDLFPSGCKDYCEVWRVAAKVVAANHDAGKTIVLLDVGTDAGVTRTMRGRLIDDDGRPLPGLFTIVGSRSTRTKALVDRRVDVNVRQLLLFDESVAPMPPDPPAARQP